MISKRSDREPRRKCRDEFFAVTSEMFFEWPHELKADYPEVYEQLALFYRQDPGLRLPA